MLRVCTLVGCAVALAASTLTGCSGSNGIMANPVGPSAMTGNSPTYTSNGQRIYFTASSASGAPITYTGGPSMGMMGRLACVMCHGQDGHGGSVVMGQLVKAPNITWPALTQPDPTSSDPPYTEDTVKRAITQGVDASGQPLDGLMPRWSMSASDLNDLVAYLKTMR